ncbi:hypothetical protein BOTNAR_0560g00050 [Botryotinia narcissicola]|uniref:Uncharacterized protein n=1 Tax=Botryotinia narcissicola TaxID=278944 RepID=A0A4Z1HCG8_9HELO|nr:hypothetical protein BOTNAR_0560g00050 [Botryotinia narcissicola]
MKLLCSIVPVYTVCDAHGNLLGVLVIRRPRNPNHEIPVLAGVFMVQSTNGDPRLRFRLFKNKQPTQQPQALTHYAIYAISIPPTCVDRAET